MLQSDAGLASLTALLQDARTRGAITAAAVFLALGALAMAAESELAMIAVALAALFCATRATTATLEELAL
jgi:hypothetical protein